MDEGSWSRCRQCDQRFRQASGSGRRRVYCTSACRRRAQRVRDARRGQPGPALAPERLQWGRLLAEDVHALAGRLVQSEGQGEPLGVLLNLADQLVGEVGSYCAAAVHDARGRGATWEQVGTAARVGAETARGRWSERQVRQKLADRTRQARLRDQQASAPQPAVARTVLEREKDRGQRTQGAALASALRVLQGRCDIRVQILAQKADLSSSYVWRVLVGERMPAWPVLHMLVSIKGGEPEELRLLWEQAQGVARTARQPVAEAAARVTSALRGQYLAAGAPDLTTLCGSHPGLHVHTVGAVLRGETVPDWETVSALVAALGGQPAGLRPWWEDLHYACLASAVPGMIPHQAVGRGQPVGPLGHQGAGHDQQQ